MAAQNLQALTAAYFPQAHCSVKAAAGENFPIGAESHRSDTLSVTLEDDQALTATYFPQAHRLVNTAAGKSLSVEAESDGSYSMGMSLKRLQWETTSRMPKPNLTRYRSSYQQISLPGEHHTMNTSEGIGKHRCCQIGLSKIDFG